MGFAARVGRFARRALGRARREVGALANRAGESDRHLGDRLAADAERLPAGVVVVLAASAGDAERWRRAFPARDVHAFVLRPGASNETAGFGPVPVADAAALELALRSVPGIALFLDTSGSEPATQLAVWTAAYPSVRAGGRYVVIDERHPHTRHDAPAWARAVGARVDGAGEANGAVGAELARATASVAATARTLVFEKSEDHYLAVTDADAEELLPERAPRLTVSVLQEIPAEAYEYRGRIVQHPASEPVANFPTSFEAPEMRLRFYEGELRWLSHMAVVHENTILPPSFRFPRHNLDNPVLDRIRVRHYGVPSRFDETAVELDGVYYDLSSGLPSHFGHFMQQSVAKLWGWDAAKDRFPELKALVQIRPGHGHAVEERILNAYGIPSGDIEWVDQRLALHSFVAAASMYQMHPPPHIHPHLQSVWARLAEQLVRAEDEPIERLFVSRRPTFDGRSCRNLEEVEQFFIERGFTVFYPEDHDVSVQATRYAEARIIAGVGGSSMFNLAYARSLETLIILNHEAYTARNEHLISAFGDWTTHYFWSRPEIPHPKNGWRLEAYRSAWSFDFARNGAELADVVDAL